MIYERDKLIFASGRFVRMLDEGEELISYGIGALLRHPDRDPVYMAEMYGRLFMTRPTTPQSIDELWLSYAFAVPRCYPPIRLRPRALDRWFEPNVYEIDEIHLSERGPPVKVTRSFAQFDERTYEMTLKGWRLIVGMEPRRGAARRARLRAERVAAGGRPPHPMAGAHG